jgi:hypothetical protein
VLPHLIRPKDEVAPRNPQPVLKYPYRARICALYWIPRLPISPGLQRPASDRLTQHQRHCREQCTLEMGPSKYMMIDGIQRMYDVMVIGFQVHTVMTVSQRHSCSKYMGYRE